MLVDEVSTLSSGHQRCSLSLSLAFLQQILCSSRNALEELFKTALAIFASRGLKFHQRRPEHRTRRTQIDHASRVLDSINPGCRHLCKWRSKRDLSSEQKFPCPKCQASGQGTRTATAEVRQRERGSLFGMPIKIFLVKSKSPRELLCLRLPSFWHSRWFFSPPHSPTCPSLFRACELRSLRDLVGAASVASQETAECLTMLNTTCIQPSFSSLALSEREVVLVS